MPADFSAAPSMEPKPTLPEPGPGDIGCVSIKGDVGFLIRLGQACLGLGFRNIEHCFVHLGVGRIVEAEPGGAREANLDEYDGRTIVWVRCPDEHRDAVAAAARGLIGTPYAGLDYVAIAAHRFHIPGFKRIALSTSSMICSTLSVIAARRGGWRLLIPTPAGYVVPDMVAALADPPA